MKNILTNNKYIFLGSIIFFSLLFVSNQAHANTIALSAQDGSNINYVVNISPGTTLSPNSSFTVTGSIQSQSTISEDVALTVSNNGGSPVNIIPQQDNLNIDPDGYLDNVISMTAPGSIGNYNLSFTPYVHFRNEIDGTLSGSGSTVNVNLVRSNITSMSLPFTSLFNNNGTSTQSSYNINIPYGSTSGSATPAGSATYTCTNTNYPLDNTKYQYSKVGTSIYDGIFYFLSVDHPC
jgi:hypothetical protein